MSVFVKSISFTIGNPLLDLYVDGFQLHHNNNYLLHRFCLMIF